MLTLRSSSASWPEAEISLGGGRRLSLGASIGSGSFSHVFRASLSLPYGLVRPVAVKLFRIGSSDDLDLAANAIRRALQKLSLVQHANVTEVYELGLFEGHPIAVMELVPGIDLAELLAAYAVTDSRVPLDLALFLATEIADALEAARTTRDLRDVQMDITHLDLTAGDVRLSTRGEVKVGGFGMGLTRQAGSGMQSLKAMARRASMLAPEIAWGIPGDARSDVFSLGALLREMVIGPRIPKDVSDVEAVRMARQGYVPPVFFEPKLPRDLQALLTRALAAQPELRFAHAGEMAAELRRVTGALALGVGDGRAFLRHAISELAIPERDEDEAPTARIRVKLVGDR